MLSFKCRNGTEEAEVYFFSKRLLGLSNLIMGVACEACRGSSASPTKSGQSRGGGHWGRESTLTFGGDPC